jgi:hypothetical protein
MLIVGNNLVTWHNKK